MKHLKKTACTLLGCFAVAAQSAVITVDNAGDTSDNRHCTLRDAVAAANSNLPVRGCAAGSAGADSIQFAGDSDIVLENGEIDISEAVIIDGGTFVVRIRGNQTARIFRSHAETTLKALTVAQGKTPSGTANAADGYGGAVYATAALRVIDSQFVDNEAGSSGGAIFADALLTVNNSLFRQNRAQDNGGALAANQNSTVTRSTFATNQATAGGAIYAANVSVEYSTFTDNEASNFGGGMLAKNGNVRIDHSTFAANRAGNDGAVLFTYPQNSNLSVNITNSIFLGNRQGGVMSNCSDFLNSAFSGNHNVLDAACATLAATQPAVQLVDVLATDNNKPMLADNGCQTPAAGGCVPTIRLLGTATNPALDSGTGNEADQRGVAVTGMQADIGAYESNDRRLTITPSTHGEVSASASGQLRGNINDCGATTSDCQADYTVGTVVTLTPTADAGYAFTGWNGCTPTTSNDITLSSDQTCEAQFVQQHTVSFNLQGHGSAITAQTVNHGGAATAPTAPTATGFTFGGWYRDATTNNAYDFSTVVNSDVTLYAKWTAAPITPSAPKPVPALSAWAMLMLSALLGALAIRRRTPMF